MSNTLEREIPNHTISRKNPGMLSFRALVYINIGPEVFGEQWKTEHTELQTQRES